MERRDFLKLASVAGLSVACPFGASPARGEPDDYEGPLWLFLHARGGWDTTLLMEPRGLSGMNNYSAGDIGTAGDIRYAPVPGHREFFEKYYRRLCIVNGVEIGATAHPSAKRYTFTGSLRHTHPSIEALIAGAKAPWKPLTFLANGTGTPTPTKGVVHKVRASDLDTLQRTAYPNEAMYYKRQWRDYHTDDEAALLEEAIRARMERRLERTRLAEAREQMGTMQTAFLNRTLLQDLGKYMPEELDRSDNPLKKQAQVTLASYRAGLCVAARLFIRDFDTHTNNDPIQIPNLQKLLRGVDFLWEEAERQGIAERIVLVVGSELGRGPYYNDSGGKGHYPVGSWMVMGPGVEGNRVVGATDEELTPRRIHPDSLEVDDGDGVILRPEHVHDSLRRLAGIEADALVRRFPLQGEKTASLFG